MIRVRRVRYVQRGSVVERTARLFKAEKPAPAIEEMRQAVDFAITTEVIERSGAA